MLYSIVGLLVIILDQAVKFWVSDTLFGTDVVRFIPGVISLVNVHNDGAAFSFLSGSGARIYFIIATGVFVLLVIIALATNFIRGKFSRWCLVLVAAGGIGNMIDRIIYGYVQDMFKVELFNFAIFNVADVFITVFAILFALSMIFERPESDLNDVLYENDPEDDRPAKKEKAPRKALFGKKKAAEPEQEELSGEAEAPALASAPPETNPVRAARKSRQEKYEQEYEEYKAQQRAAMNRKKAPAAPAERESKAPAPQAASADPYDAWVQASARAGNRATSYADRVMDVPKASTPAPQPRPAAQTARPAPAAPAPAAPAPQPAAPAPQPKPAAQNEEFDLDDILAEFK